MATCLHALEPGERWERVEVASHEEQGEGEAHAEREESVRLVAIRRDERLHRKVDDADARRPTM